MPRLIRVFAGCTDQFVGFFMRRLICRVYLTNTDTAVRSRGTRLLAEILNNLPTDFVSQKEGESFCLPTPFRWGDILFLLGERGGSVVECRTPEREVLGSRPTSAVLCP